MSPVPLIKWNDCKSSNATKKLQSIVSQIKFTFLSQIICMQEVKAYAQRPSGKKFEICLLIKFFVAAK